MGFVTQNMSTARWRWVLIAAWICITCISFVAIDSVTARNWLLLVVFTLIPPVMLFWLWNDDRPQLLGSLSSRRNRP